MDSVDQHPVLQPPLGHPVERQRRRAERVLHCYRRDVAAGHVLGGLDGGVVDVAGSGRGDDHQQLPIECAGALKLAQGQIPALVLCGRALEPHENADGLGRGRLSHDPLDQLSPQGGGDVPPALPAEGAPGDQAPRSTADHR